LLDGCRLFFAHCRHCREEKARGIEVTFPIAYYLVLSAVLFSIGVAAFLIKRNIITIFMSIELMLNAVNLAFIAFSRQWSQTTGQLQVNGQIFVFFVMVVAAAEAAVGLAIVIAVFRARSTLNVDSIDLMKL
jgi:NADH-quinone oxidoreductase subunit K